jgi:putative spermidine/putrescine transport system ATP-binding protein
MSDEEPGPFPTGGISTDAKTQDDIEVMDLSKSYGGAMAVDNVTFRLQAGEFLTLLGPSGSGKTSTLHMVAGFETPTHGDIRIRGESVLGVPPNHRNLGVGFQSYALFPHMSVAENVEFPLRMRGVARRERRRRACDILERVGLQGLESRRPRQLSGGQQQRVSLARSIVFDPAALLLDEPLGALDKRLRERLQIEIRDVHKRTGLSVLYVTHDQDEAMMMSDRIAIMREGRIVQIGPPADVYRHPSSPFVAHFLGETNLIPCKQQPSVGPDVGVSYRDGSAGLVRRRDHGVESEGNLVSVRPESVEIRRDRHDGQNSFAATVIDLVYLGSHVRYNVKAIDQEITVKTPAEESCFQRGEGVHIGWNAQNAQLLRDDD